MIKSITHPLTCSRKQALFLFLILQSMGYSYAQGPGSWVQKNSLPSDGRGAPVSFAIGDKAYVGTGLNFNTASLALIDFWEYDPPTDVWTQIADYGGGGRGAAAAFVIGEKGYVLTGADASATKKKDIWEYDPSLNTWTQKADLPGDARNYSTAFAVGNKGYIATGSGNSGDLQDCWQYDPVSDSWTQKANMSGPSRSSAVSFGIDGKGYLGTGYIGGYSKSFYAYDTLLNSWTQMSNAGTSSRSDAAAFVLNGHGFVCGGYTNAGYSDDLLEYDPASDTWTSKASFIGLGKADLTCFSVGDYGYAGMGYDNQFNQTNGLYQYSLDSTIATFTTELNAHPQIVITPNPLTDGGSISVSTAANVTATLFSSEGKRISPTHFTKQVS
ncbi:MAG TPA: kelch repeat-containing protein, partial [Puia sp.]|nr:kelch repeat-containing protein [Puia sp.]